MAALAEEPEIHAAPDAPDTQDDTIPRLRLTLTQSEIQTLIRQYQAIGAPPPDGQLDEIEVTAPVDPVPMRDSARDIWGGLAAPVWALLHPTQAWRIFMPVPPKEVREETP